jgi:hypothetical protein
MDLRYLPWNLTLDKDDEGWFIQINTSEESENAQSPLLRADSPTEAIARLHDHMVSIALLKSLFPDEVLAKVLKGKKL